MFRNVTSSLLKVVKVQHLVPFANATTTTVTSPHVEKSLNQVTLLGRLGTDPVVRGNEQHPVVHFTMATNSNYRQDENESLKQKTEWHRIAVFKPFLRDSVMTHMRKGRRVLVVGRLSSSDVADAQGTYRNLTSIIADDIIFVGARDQQSEEDQEEIMP